jgi:hypothetical protein
LDSIAENNHQAPNSKGIHILFHPSLFWALVDPKISQMTPPISHSQLSNDLQDATIRISTHYIQPLVESQVEQPQSAPEANDRFSWDVGALEQVNLDDIFASWMPGLDELE